MPTHAYIYIDIYTLFIYGVRYIVIWGKHSTYPDFGFAPSNDIMNKAQASFFIPTFLTF